MEDLITYCQPTGPLPGLVNSKSGSLLIMGCAPCVWDDLKAYDCIHKGDRMGVNESISAYKGRYQHCVSLHPARLYFWTKTREDKPLIHSTHRAGGFPEIIWPLHRDGALSGIFACLISLLMGYEQVIVAGMPCDSTGNFYENEPRPLAGADSTKAEWLRAHDAVFKGRVKSLSGWTKDQFGAPDA